MKKLRGLLTLGIPPPHFKKEHTKLPPRKLHFYCRMSEQSRGYCSREYSAVICMSHFEHIPQCILCRIAILMQSVQHFDEGSKLP